MPLRDQVGCIPDLPARSRIEHSCAVAAAHSWLVIPGEFRFLPRIQRSMQGGLEQFFTGFQEMHISLDVGGDYGGIGRDLADVELEVHLLGGSLEHTKAHGLIATKI